MNDRHYSPDTYATLRNVRLLDEGEIDGVRFVRCIPHRASWDGVALTAEERLSIVTRAVAEIGEGVCLSNNPNYGGDYLRVTVGSPAFRLICHMKS